MTATEVSTELPDYNGEHVSRAVIKITGAGTGMDEGLGVLPMVLDVDDEAYFVVRTTCAEPSHYRDKNGLLVRRHRLHTESMAPIDKATAVKAIEQYNDQVEKAKADQSGQLLLDQENEALEREARD